MPDQERKPSIPVKAETFAHALPHFAKQIAGHGRVKIVAIGSSSTAGEGGIVPYPTRLQSALQAHYRERVFVLNRGIGGQEAPEELDRFQADVIDEKPALVIWQVGTNAVWQPGRNFEKVAKAIKDGLEQLASEAADVVLMDLQYVPALLTDDKIAATRRMLSLIGEIAAATPYVNVFHRFTMMRKWHEIEKRSFDTMVDPVDDDRLHQSDYSTQRIVYELREQIVKGVERAGAPQAKAC